MFEKYTEGARSAIFVARLEAVRRGFRTIEPAHLLLGVLQQGEIDPLFADDLPKLETIRGILVNGLTAGREPLPDKTDIPLAHTSKRILAYAAEEIGVDAARSYYKCTLPPWHSPGKSHPPARNTVPVSAEHFTGGSDFG